MGLHHVAAVLFTILFALIVVGATAPRLLVIVGAWRTALLLTGCPPARSADARSRPLARPAA